MPPAKTGGIKSDNLLSDLLVNGDLLAILSEMLEADGTVSKSEKGIVLALAYVGTRMDLGTALADEDVSGKNELTVSPLNAKAFGLGIAAVLGGAHSLFMCHLCYTSNSSV